MCYVVRMDGISYYNPGDSDLIPEMKQIETDIAFLPVCGKNMMNVEDAVKAALDIKPQIVIPFHFGSVLGSKADGLFYIFSRIYLKKNTRKQVFS